MDLQQKIRNHRMEIVEEFKILESEIKDLQNRIRSIDLIHGLLLNEYFAKDKIIEKEKKALARKEMK